MVGDEIVVLPSNRTATIAEIVAPVPGDTGGLTAPVPQP